MKACMKVIQSHCEPVCLKRQQKTKQSRIGTRLAKVVSEEKLFGDGAGVGGENQSKDFHIWQFSKSGIPP